MTYDDLITEAEKLGLKVRELNLITKDGYCKGNRIAINKNIPTEAEKKCILAEEIAHFKLTAGNITDQNVIQNRRQELKARRHSYKYLIEPIDLIYAFRNGAKNRYEMAELLNVTEETLEEILIDFRKFYGIGVQMGNYYLQLEPFVGIHKRF
ncbi:MAG: ImmA/IrrE family metallo-endopeptidase [Clostridium sp.]|uniref:ImmA/IrrE family metallo-endopeptidase n=1 Tax=Clostridium sp. TaxID=1506 RepID=UPI0025BD09DE|nr:ImmA/IrrE family metallo-endopeptidase [Clostridium sp.]MBS4958183.1 ImmA/IrrE family metallo-endopeptidase [Clostridium sp.]